MGNKILYDGKEYGCGFELTLNIISGKWKGLILWHLQDETLRYGELRKVLGKITQKMLTASLRELEKYKLITRKVYPVVPPKVEYRITKRGLRLIPIFVELRDWGHETAFDDGEVLEACSKSTKRASSDDLL